MGISVPPEMIRSAPCPVETDENLIVIRRVRADNGKYYDVFIWKCDAQGNPIPVQAGHPLFLVDTLNKITGLVRGIISKADSVEDYTFFYQDGQCIQQEDETGHRNTLDDPSDQESPAYYLEQIHKEYTLMEPMTGRVPSEMIVYARKADQEIHPYSKKRKSSDPIVLSEKKKEIKVKPSKKQKQTPSSKFLPQSIQSPEQEEKVIRNLTTLANLQGSVFEDTRVLYSQLRDYALTKKGDKNVERAYKAFEELLKNPATQNQDAIQMKKWLEKLYKEISKAYLGITGNELYKKDQETGEQRPIEEWARDFALRWLLYGIRSDIQADALKLELAKTKF